MAEKITLTKQDRKKVWWRHQFLHSPRHEASRRKKKRKSAETKR